MRPLVYGSVCSGVEAATLAWEPLGWKPAFFSEIEDAPRAVLKHRWPNVPLHGDFTTIKDGDYEAIDLLVGGTPCQDFSIAGLRKGITGDRGNLTLEFLRLADRLHPKWICWENVCGVLSIDGGKAFGSFLGGLAEIGYGFAYRILDAQFFGVPQRRRRVFVVGYFGDWRPPAAVLFDGESLRGNPAPRRETRQETSCDVRSGVAGTLGAHQSGGWGAGGDLDTCGAIIPENAHTLRGEGADASEDGTGRGTPLVGFRMAAFGEYSDDDTASTIKSRDHKDATDLIAFEANGTQVQIGDDFAPTLRSMNNPNSNIAGSGHLAVAISLRGRDGGATAEITQGANPALRASQGGGDKAHVMTFDSQQITSKANQTRVSPELPASTVAARSKMHLAAIGLDLRNATRDPEKHDEQNRQGVGVGDDKAPTLSAGQGHGVGTHTAVRRLTPRECERLQGMPDDHTLVPVGKKFKLKGSRRNSERSMTSYAARYKMIGNSMAVPVMAKIGERIDLIRKLMEEINAAK